MSHQVIIFYKYVRIEKPNELMLWLRKVCEDLGIFGRILVAHEGINGTVEGTPEQIEAFTKKMHSQNGDARSFTDFSDVWFKASEGNGKAFPNLKIKVRNEIVTTGLAPNEDINPNEITGTHIEPEELKKWIESGEEFEIIDMRNDYEYAVGHFKNSHNPQMENFRDLTKVTPKFEEHKEKKVLTVCTYGVRCEKASGYLKKQGFKNVYQLNGGIGSYMKKFPGKDFEGSLYVFDSRMTEHFNGENHKPVGKCYSCQATSERFGNCAYDECHKQLIICQECSVKEVYCKTECQLARA